MSIEIFTKYKNEIWKSVLELKKYYDMGFILSNLESIIVLPTPYKNPKEPNEVYEENRTIAKQSVVTAKETFSKFNSELSLRAEVFEYIRKINPDFCQNIVNKLSKSEYQEYTNLWMKCKKDINTLIADFKDKDGNYKDLWLYKKDLVSNIIDSKSASKLSYIEDNFVLNELDSIDISNIDLDMVEKIDAIRSDLTERLRKYKLFEELLAKKEIKFSSKRKQIYPEER